jgi:hypothetical protein
VPEFEIGSPVENDSPAIEVTVSPDKPLAIGRHRFQLVVADDSGNASQPDLVEIIVRDSQAPTAVIDAPTQVEFGQSFAMSGKRSSDIPPGKVVKFVWTLLD